MKNTWISIGKIKQHELHSTLRHIKASGRTWPEVYCRLGELQKQAAKALAKVSSILFLMFLILRSFGDGSTVSIEISNIAASIPAEYITFVSSMLLLYFSLCLQQFFSIISFRAKESSRHKIRNFHAGAYGFLEGQDDFALAVPSFNSVFFTERLPISSTLSWILVICFLSLVIPIAYIWLFVWSSQHEIISNSSAVSSGWAIAALGQFILSCSAIYLLLFNIPLPVRRNSTYIRWLLLAPLTSKEIHPQAKNWLAEK